MIVDRKRLFQALAVYIAAVLMWIFFPQMPGFIVVLSLTFLYIVDIFMVATAKPVLAGQIRSAEEKDIVFSFDVNIENRGTFAFLPFKADLEVVNILNGESLYKEEIYVSGKRKAFTIFVESSYCGKVKINFSDVKVVGLFDIFIKPVNFRMEAVHTVYPKLRSMIIEDDAVMGYDMESFRYSESKKGSDPGEIFGIREYVPGDSRKAVHWKLSGKMDELMIREMGYPVENNVLIILEKLRENIDPAEIEKETSLFLSLSSEMTRQGIRHDVGWQEGDSFRILKGNNINSAQTLGASCFTKGVDAAASFIMSNYEKSYSNYIYIGNRKSGAMRLVEYGKVAELQ